MAKKRLTVNLTDELVEALRDLAERNDTTVTDELRRAIQDRKYFADRVRQGAEVYLEQDRDGDGVKERTEVVLR